MELITTATETFMEYVFTVSDTQENTFEYKFNKSIQEGFTSESYIQACKSEAELLAQYELNKRAEPQNIAL